MQDTVLSIAQYLEGFNSSDYNLRQLRSGILAQLIANQITLDADSKVGDEIAEHKTAIKQLISAVNEYVAIDYPLTEALLHQILVTRQMLIFGVHTTELLRFVMNNKVAESNIDPKLNDILVGISGDGASVERLSALSGSLYSSFEGAEHDD